MGRRRRPPNCAAPLSLLKAKPCADVGREWKQGKDTCSSTGPQPRRQSEYAGEPSAAAKSHPRLRPTWTTCSGDAVRLQRCRYPSCLRRRLLLQLRQPHDPRHQRSRRNEQERQESCLKHVRVNAGSECSSTVVPSAFPRSKKVMRRS